MTEPKVLVIGEAIADIVTTKGRTTEHPGGSPANVALGLGRRGRDVAILTRLGRDTRGARIVRHLERSFVEVLAESFTDDPTSTARASLASDGSAQYDFDIVWTLPLAIPELGPSTIHTGSLAAFLEPGASRLVNFLKALEPHTITFDPNIRPALMSEHGRAVKQFETIAGMSTLVKLSDEDAAWLYPHLSTEEALDHVQQLGPPLAAITLGGDGAILSTGANRATITAVSTSVADTIGAGDAFMTSLIDDLLGDGVGTDRVPRSSAELDHLGLKAAAAAAIAVSRPGADLPWRRELDTTNY